MAQTHNALTRLTSIPNLVIIAAMAFLFSPLVIEQMRPAEYWLRVVSITVQDARAGESPAMIVQRQIIRPFVGEWTVLVRRQKGAGWEIVCTADGAGNYRPDATLPDDLDMNWWTDGQCPTLPPGTYHLTTLWGIQPEHGAERRILIESNVFGVLP